MKTTDWAAEHYFNVSAESSSQIGLIEPDSPDVSSGISQNDLGSSPRSEEGYPGLPNCTDNSLLFIFLKPSNWFYLAIVYISVWKEI